MRTLPFLALCLAFLHLSFPLLVHSRTISIPAGYELVAGQLDQGQYSHLLVAANGGNQPLLYSSYVASANTTVTLLAVQLVLPTSSVSGASLGLGLFDGTGRRLLAQNREPLLVTAGQITYYSIITPVNVTAGQSYIIVAEANTGNVSLASKDPNGAMLELAALAPSSKSVPAGYVLVVGQLDQGRYGFPLTAKGNLDRRTTYVATCNATVSLLAVQLISPNTSVSGTQFQLDIFDAVSSALLAQRFAAVAPGQTSYYVAINPTSVIAGRSYILDLGVESGNLSIATQDISGYEVQIAALALASTPSSSGAASSSANPSSSAMPLSSAKPSSSANPSSSATPSSSVVSSSVTPSSSVVSSSVSRSSSASPSSSAIPSSSATPSSSAALSSADPSSSLSPSSSVLPSSSFGPAPSSSTAIGQAYSDPRIVGFWGQNQYVAGEDGGVYSMLLDERVAVNARFVLLNASDIHCPTQLSTYCVAEKGTYFGEVGVVTSNGDRFEVVAGSAEVGFSVVRLNGKALIYEAQSSTARVRSADGTQTENGLTVLLTSNRSLEFSVGIYSIRLDVVDRYMDFVSVNTNCWACLLEDVRPDGLLGRTWDSSVEHPTDDEAVEQYRETNGQLLGCNFVVPQNNKPLVCNSTLATSD